MAQDLSSGWAGVDFEALFHAFPTPCVVLDTDLVIREPNAAFLTVTGRRRDHLVGRGLFTAFPELDPSNGAAANVERVLRRALLTGRPAVLGDDRFAIAVGDVVGHGLNAAVLMGQLRAALNALTLADLGPAEALAGLDRFTRQDSDAAVSTAVKVIIDLDRRTLTYSSAGHPPALLLHPDGTCQVLDDAGPALALPIETGPRPTATTGYVPGARLLLYTDGLVEHRAEDIDVSVSRVAARLRDARALSPAEMVDHLIAGIPPTTTTTSPSSWSSCDALTAGAVHDPERRISQSSEAGVPSCARRSGRSR